MSDFAGVFPGEGQAPVDAEWYLRTYPDVAAAGMDPQAHYALHGRAEGRLPRPLNARRLENALWTGFKQKALPELLAWHATTDDFDERVYAAWALARWFVSHQEWSQALPLVADLTAAPPPYLDHLGPCLLATEILLRNECLREAQDCIARAIEQHGPKGDLCLAAANILLPGPQTADADSLRLAWINRALTTARLAPLVKHDPKQPLTLDNVQATAELQADNAGMPVISVIMPVFNAEAFVETALRSVLAQSWPHLEVLVVDDDSSDATCARVETLVRQDGRIRLLRQPVNRGAYAARNAGLREARGDFVVNHDSDDWSHPQRLERMVRPLLDDPRRMASLADWVRADTHLHFQHWRIEDRLIEPSVSTWMVRRCALERLGSWDEVRVAADQELRQRLVRLYGAEAVTHVLPGVPLVLARYWPESLTMASGTHLRSTFFGPRRLYMELAETWQAMANGADDLYLPNGAADRPFPAPASLLSDFPEPADYDWLLIGDLSPEASSAAIIERLLERLLSAHCRVALLHWPDYARPDGTVARPWLELAVRSRVDIVLAEQQVQAGHVVIIGRHLLASPSDNVPHLRALHFQVVDRLDEIRHLPPRSQERQSQVYAATDMDMMPPDLFRTDWYLHHYPDVRAANSDPWQHYLRHGAAEGRDPGPQFDTAHYLRQCPDAASSGLPPLLHYLQVGQHLGIDPRPPTLPGRQPHRPERPTLLLCAHAAAPQLFGAERCLLDVLDACIRLGLNVVVSLPGTANAEYVEALRERARKVVCIPTSPWQADTPPCPYAQERFAELICTEAVDLVQVNTITLREPLLAARQAAVPALTYVHESPAHDADIASAIGLPVSQIVAQVLADSDHILANSAFTARQFDKPGATDIVGNIVDLDAFALPNTIEAGAITAALISSNLPKKGLSDLATLAQLMARSTPNVRLLLIGPDNNHVEALRCAQTRGDLPDNLQFMPYAPSPQAAIAQANIVLNLSHCQETFGRTALEGLAAGRPVLAYRHGALPELIEDGVNGFLVPQGEVAAIAERLHWLCQSPQRILAMGEMGRRTAHNYNLSRLCQQLAQAYATALQVG